MWFTIYFESGIAKIASGDPEWRNLTAMDEYYQNGPLPTWIGWYVSHLPHRFHAATAARSSSIVPLKRSVGRRGGVWVMSRTIVSLSRAVKEIFLQSRGCDRRSRFPRRPGGAGRARRAPVTPGH